MEEAVEECAQRFLSGRPSEQLRDMCRVQRGSSVSYPNGALLLLFESLAAQQPQKFLFLPSEQLTVVLQGMDLIAPTIQYCPQTEVVVCLIVNCGDDKIYHRFFLYSF